MKYLKFILVFVIAATFSGCNTYSFTGISVDADSFQVKHFQNNAELVEPGIERSFTNKLQELIQNQTRLNLTDSNPDLVYEGEITQYRISPMTATANQGAAQNRLSITVNVRFSNKNNPDGDFEKPFNFYYDYSGNDLPPGSVLTTAVNEIFQRISQDVFNESLTNWSKA
ncbi:LptE family protein [Flavobacterium rakeshii]|uniref:LptE family protein n=1 Tax=Flavobacterium rakeshii TaxID=1038845 RepID=UPI002E7AD7CF|nr:LptE family protein [Flavobacterium rakeshii]MEE1899641.1 LptE family protein [Flavobacterium rakeshii]